MNRVFFEGFGVIILCILALISLNIRDEIYMREDIPHHIRRCGYKFIIVNKIIMIILTLLIFISLIW